MSSQPSSSPSVNAGFVIDADAHAIRFTRRFTTAPSVVFEAWTDPDQVALWWDATGEPLGACEIDLRPGGAFRFVTRHHPEKPFTGVYREIIPPVRLVFDANGAIGTVAIVDAPSGGCVMTVEIRSPSAEHLDHLVQFGVHLGTDRTLDNLKAYVEGQR